MLIANFWFEVGVFSNISLMMETFLQSILNDEIRSPCFSSGICCVPGHLFYCFGVVMSFAFCVEGKYCMMFWRRRSCDSIFSSAGLMETITSLWSHICGTRLDCHQRYVRCYSQYVPWNRQSFAMVYLYYTSLKIHVTHLFVFFRTDWHWGNLIVAPKPMK